MRLDRITYRFRQFWQAIYAVPNPADLKLVQNILTPAQVELFSRLQPSEQSHGLQVFKRLYAESQAGTSEYSPDLLVAALLHDVGKSCHPLYLWERVLIVLVKAISPQSIQRWGRLPANRTRSSRFGWRRPFVIAEQHPGWGAEMATEAGCSPLAVALIQRHQEESALDRDILEDRLLARLQSADGSY